MSADEDMPLHCGGASQTRNDVAEKKRQREAGLQRWREKKSKLSAAASNSSTSVRRPVTRSDMNVPLHVSGVAQNTPVLPARRRERETALQRWVAKKSRRSGADDVSSTSAPDLLASTSFLAEPVGLHQCTQETTCGDPAIGAVESECEYPKICVGAKHPETSDEQPCVHKQSILSRTCDYPIPNVLYGTAGDGDVSAHRGSVHDPSSTSHGGNTAARPNDGRRFLERVPTSAYALRTQPNCRALLAIVRSKGGIALATATSGIAASILPGGRTAHSRFKIPIDLSDIKSCKISKQSSLGVLIRDSRLIVWDEAPMAKRDTIEALDLALQDLCGSAEIFGGKVIVFGGDFRQVLPVVRRGNRKETVDACLTSSDLWPQLKKLKLTENMRARLDPWFTEMLLKIGNGQETTFEDDLIKIPASLALADPVSEESLDELITTIYPNLASLTEMNLSMNRAILTTKNCFVDEVNKKLINEFPGDLVEYLSFDRVENPSHEAEYGDIINSLTPSGLLEHRLSLKENAPVILLRNLDPTEGLSRKGKQQREKGLL
ncbi:PIF1 helicase [Striga hermonthica]|uniref:ATP-dependent DNA helicase n=1 Tax=Striga hermonthica TaxID=68872 RepID=A0A9N7R3Z2_STRHE|nr:PIF1 helicase [Striga hermonthica]